MSKAWVVDGELWKLIEPVLPPWPQKAPGPRPVPDRLFLQRTLFVLHTGIGWGDLPQELGFGSGMTCWRRLQRWTEVGVFDQVHQILLARLNTANRIDWSRAAINGSHIDATMGAPEQACRRSTAADPARSTLARRMIHSGRVCVLCHLASHLTGTSRSILAHPRLTQLP